ncbi:MAG: MFS transporter [Phycisphaerales bacterium]|nr:MFS transporter [Phycisphaerales bacterium]
MKNCYPLKGLARQGQIWSWISYDVANQSFTLIINTLLFPVFFTHVVVANKDIDDTLWAVTYTASMLLTVAFSPIAGAIADERAWKKPMLIGTGLACGVLTCMLGLIAPGQLWLAMLLYIPANLLFSVGENFLASFLPDLAQREQFGRVSGFSWGVAYAAALVLLIITAAAMSLLHLKDADHWRGFFVFAGLWFIAFTIPTIFILHERPRAAPARSGSGLIKSGFVRLGRTLKSIRQFRDLVVLLAASLLYGTGMSVVVFFASILARDFGFTDVDLVLFIAVITVSGIIGTLVPTLIQDRLGHKNTTLLLLGVWILTASSLTVYAYIFQTAPASTPAWPLWVSGNLLGFGLGSLGSANRAFVGFLTPASRSGEFFGLWGMVFKLAAVCTIPFAIVKDQLGTAASLVVLTLFLIAGFIVTLFINEKRGGQIAEGGGDASYPVPGPLPAPAESGP